MQSKILDNAFDEVYNSFTLFADYAIRAAGSDVIYSYIIIIIIIMILLW